MNGLLTTNLVWTGAVVLDLAIKIAAIIVIPRNRKPSSAMAWLLAVFLIPYAGVIFFLLLGSSKLPRKRRQKQAKINTLILEGSADVGPAADRGSWPQWLAPIVGLNRNREARPTVT